MQFLDTKLPLTKKVNDFYKRIDASLFSKFPLINIREGTVNFPRDGDLVRPFLRSHKSVSPFFLEN